MLDLQSKSGLPISLRDDGLLEFHPPLVQVKPKQRAVADMKEYLADQNAEFTNGDAPYLMYGKVHLSKDHEKFEKMGIRYDLTVFRPGLIGKEFCKSIGHFHAKKPGTNVAFPEVYEVVHGRALFLIQKLDETNETVEVRLPPAGGRLTSTVSLVSSSFWIKNSARP